MNNFDLENSFGQTSLTGTVAGWYTIRGREHDLQLLQLGLARRPGGDEPPASTSRPIRAASTRSRNERVRLVWTRHGRRRHRGESVARVDQRHLLAAGGRARDGPQLRPVSLALQRVRLHRLHAVSEYGDDHDVMGNYAAGHFNAYQKERLGWLNSRHVAADSNGHGAGPYTLEALRNAIGRLPKALEVFKSTSAGLNTYLYAEARTQHGIDTTLTPGVLIHSGVDTDGNQSFLQDVLPTTATSDFILDPGQSVTFAGDTSPITFTTLSSGASGAVVAVTQSTGSMHLLVGIVGAVDGLWRRRRQRDADDRVGLLLERDEQRWLDHARRRQHERTRAGDHPVHRCCQCLVVASHRHGDDHRPDLHRDAGRRTAVTRCRRSAGASRT